MTQSIPKPMNAQVFDVEDGHIVMKYRADGPVTLRTEPASVDVVFDLTPMQVGILDKAAIVRVALSPSAAHSLLVQLRAIEDMLLPHIEGQKERTIQ